MVTAALSPERAVAELEGYGADFRATVVLSPDGEVAAHRAGDDELAGRLGELLDALFRRAPSVKGAKPEQIEIGLPGGSVFAVRRAGWTVGAVCDRGALSSLVFYDLRMALAPVIGAAPAGFRRPPA